MQIPQGCIAALAIAALQKLLSIICADSSSQSVIKLNVPPRLVQYCGALGRRFFNTASMSGNWEVNINRMCWVFCQDNVVKLTVTSVEEVLVVDEH